MIMHYIIMSSSYSKGTRIALDNIVSEENYNELKEIVKDIIKEIGKDVSISSHSIQTDSTSWQSVVEKDPFFKNVELIDTKEKFIKLIQQDRTLEGLDIAKYILCKVKCTHLKLEKLVYLCFAEYLCKYKEELFVDTIYSYRLGPVVKSVYNEYKGSKYQELKKDDVDIEVNDKDEMPSRSRIMFAKDGIDKIKSIDETIEKYGNLSAIDLMELTHKRDTPWEITGCGRFLDRIIDNDVIIKYHCNEVI